MTKIFIGADHAGFELKSELLAQLELEYDIHDCGTDSLERTDYPLYAKAVAQNVLDNPDAIGILICSTGIGMSIAANRYAGIRAALCHSVKAVKLSRQHNNANVLVMGASTTSADEAMKLIETFIASPFHGGRYQERLTQIDPAT
jgi:ribose 5-phosphate isomerase B